MSVRCNWDGNRGQQGGRSILNDEQLVGLAFRQLGHVQRNELPDFPLCVRSSTSLSSRSPEQMLDPPANQHFAIRSIDPPRYVYTSPLPLLAKCSFGRIKPARSRTSVLGLRNVTVTVLAHESTYDSPGRRAPDPRRGAFRHEIGTCGDEPQGARSICIAYSASHAAPWLCGCGPEARRVPEPGAQ